MKYHSMFEASSPHQQYADGHYDAHLGLPSAHSSIAYIAGYNQGKKEIRRGHNVVLSCWVGIVIVFFAYVIWAVR